MEKLKQVRSQDCLRNENVSTVCPRFVFQFLPESRETRSAGIVEPYADSCFPATEMNEMTSKDARLVNTPKWLHKSVRSSNLGQLGEVTSAVGRACAEYYRSTPESYSRFYYAASKLSEAAKKSSIEAVRIQKLLELPLDQVRCPDQSVFQNAKVACENEKSCPPPKAMNNLANRTLVELEIFKKSKRKLEELSSKCKKEESCQEDIRKLSDLVNSLILKNPWFLDHDFLTGDNFSPGFRLKRYLQKKKDQLARYQSELETASRCLHFENAQNCKVRQVREILENAPEIEIEGVSDFEKQKMNGLFQYQSCQDRTSLERDRVAELVNAPAQAVLAVGSQMSIESTIEKIALGRFQAVKSAAKVLIPKIGGLFASESAMHLFTESSSLANIKKSCVDKRIELSRVHSSIRVSGPRCLETSNMLGASEFDEASCMVDLTMAAVAISPAVGADQAFANVFRSFRTTKNSGAGKEIRSDLEVSLSRNKQVSETSDSTAGLSQGDRRKINSDAVRRATDQGAGASQKLNPANVYLSRSGIDSYMYRKPSAIAKTPPHIEIVEARKVDGRNSLMFTTPEKLADGTWVKTTKEFQVDQKTGALDATNPAGKELFERLASSFAGKAHFAFFDVARLGFVNSTFRNLAGDGDLYLKGVANMIMKHGKGLVTLARTGGDEFGLIIHETDPQKVQRILENIRNAIRDDKEGLAKKVFVSEKKDRAEKFNLGVAEFKKLNPEISDEELRDLLKFDSNVLQSSGFGGLANERRRIEDIARTSTPDVAIGSTEIGESDNLSTLGIRAESAGKSGKIETAYERGLPVDKYGDARSVKERPNPNYRAPIELPTSSPSWSDVASTSSSPAMAKLRPMQYKRGSEVLRIGDSTVAEYTDEVGKTSYRSERYVTDFKSQQKVAVLTDFPTKGTSGCLDGTHPEADYLMSQYLKKSDTQILVQPKIRSLKYLNYFDDGTQAGDEVIAVVGEILRKKARPQDLNFKLNGADFLWSGDGLTLTSAAERMAQVKKELVEHPRIRKLIADEVARLKGQILKLNQDGKVNEAAEKVSRLKKIENFDFDLQFETLTSAELKGKSSMSDIQSAFDEKFKKRYP